MIELADVTKRYGTGGGTVRALQGISFRVAEGEFVSLLGPSGSGKTTLLNLVAGLDVPDGGSVRLDGTDLRALADHQLADLRLRTIGFVFQSFNLLPALTVERNVTWPLEFAGCSRAEARRRALAALDSVGVGARASRLPSELSGGEQQRVAVARAIVTNPAIVLADEPTGNLDSRTGQTILDLLRDLNRARDVTIVLVTHSAVAAAYADRILEIEDGCIVRDTRAQEPAARAGTS